MVFHVSPCKLPMLEDINGNLIDSKEKETGGLEWKGGNERSEMSRHNNCTLAVAKGKVGKEKNEIEGLNKGKERNGRKGKEGKARKGKP